MQQEERELIDMRDLLNEFEAEIDWIGKHNAIMVPQIQVTQLSMIQRRVMVRSIFACIEATVYNLKRMANMAGTLKYYTPARLNEAELSLCREEAFELKDTGDIRAMKARLAFRPNLRFGFKVFAKAWGLQFCLDVSVQGWQRLSDAVAIRDRLMHPKNRIDLEISDAEITNAAEGFKWFKKQSLAALSELVLKLELETRNVGGQI